MRTKSGRMEGHEQWKHMEAFDFLDLASLKELIQKKFAFLKALQA